LFSGCARPCLLVLAVVFFAATGVPMTATAGELLDFELIQGKWTGFGWFIFGATERQRARCEAVIQANGGPDRGSMDLKCTSESLDIDGKAFDITLNGATATGKWALISHEIDGTLTGSVTENSLSILLRPNLERDRDYGANFFSIFENKCHATMKIAVRSPIDLKKINLSVRRC